MSTGISISFLESTVDGDTRLNLFLSMDADVKATLFLDNWKSDIPCVCWLFVHENYRRIGLGEKLLNAAIIMCKMGAKTHLHSFVRKDNIVSLELHKKLGFEFCDNYHNADYFLQLDLKQKEKQIEALSDKLCPHAGVFAYCESCPVSVCPIGLGLRRDA